jgi:uncharacterized protein (TIGR03435 family)
MKKIGELFGDGKKELLRAVGLAIFAAAILFVLVNPTAGRAQAQSQAPSAGGPLPKFEYEVASFKPAKPGTDGRVFMGFSMPVDGLNGTNITMMLLIQQAFGVQPYQISGAPDWFTSEHFDLSAKMDSETADAIQKLSADDKKIARQQMLQALLADRLKLTVRHDTKELPIYSLVIGKNGPKLKESKPDDNAAKNPNGPAGPPAPVGNNASPAIGSGGGNQSRSVTVGPGGGGSTFAIGGGPGGGMQSMSASGAPIANLVRMLSGRLGRPVLDKTGLTGKYDFKLEFAPDSNASPGFGGGDGGAPAPAADSGGPNIFTAVQEQLGLKLESGKGPVEIIVIEHAERPSEN